MFANRWMNLAMLLSLLAVSSVSRGEDEKIVLVMPNATKRAFAKLDADGDKQLTWEEYRKSTSRDLEPAAKRDFDLFDGDHDAKLTVDEFWSIPSSVSSARLRGPIADPLAGVIKRFMATIDRRLDNWDQAPKKKIPVEQFLSEVAAAAKMEAGHFDEFLADLDEEGVSREEAWRFLEVQFGWRRADGRLLREPNGRVRQHQKFQTADLDQDGRLSRQEFLERTFIPGDLAALFERADADRDEFVSWDEWCVQAYRVTDPVADFQKLDDDRNGTIDPEELRRNAPKHLQEVARSVFPGFDLDRDKKLSLDEYRLTMLANPVAKWHDDFRDMDGDGRLSWQEFLREEDVPLLRFVYFQWLDQNSSGWLEKDEFAFKHRAPREVFSLTVADGTWRRLFQFDEYPSITSLSVSPDGRRIACDAHRAGEQFTDDVVLTCNLDGTELRKFGKGMVPSWSPDGKQLGLTRTNGNVDEVFVMNIDGTAERRLHGGRGPHWSPDGTRIAFTDRDGLFVFDVATETTTPVLDRKTRGYSWIYRKLAWSPDGRQISCIGRKPDESEEVLILSMTKQPLTVTLRHTDRTIEGSLSWHPNGDRLVFPMRNRSRERIQLFEFNPVGDAAPILVNGQDPGSEIRTAAWTPDGKQLIVVTGNY